MACFDAVGSTAPENGGDKGIMLCLLSICLFVCMSMNRTKLRTDVDELCQVNRISA